MNQEHYIPFNILLFNEQMKVVRMFYGLSFAEMELILGLKVGEWELMETGEKTIERKEHMFINYMVFNIDTFYKLLKQLPKSIKLLLGESYKKTLEKCKRTNAELNKLADQFKYTLGKEYIAVQYDKML